MNGKASINAQSLRTIVSIGHQSQQGHASELTLSELEDSQMPIRCLHKQCLLSCNSIFKEMCEFFALLYRSMSKC